MNGQAFTGGADDAPPVPPWRVLFGNKASEATRGGFSRLKLALALGQPEQVCFLHAASVSGHLSTCAPVSILNRAWEAGPPALLSSAAGQDRMRVGLGPATLTVLLMVRMLGGGAAVL